MQITLTSKRQATFPAEVCKAMDLLPGSRLEIVPGSTPHEWILRPFRISSDRLAPLRGKLQRGQGIFKIGRFRSASKDYAALRD